MNNRMLIAFFLVIAIYLNLPKKAYGDFLNRKSCTIEIYYAHVLPMLGLKPSEVKTQATNIIIYTKENLEIGRGQLFSAALQEFKKRDSDSVDFRWAIFVKDNNTNITHIYYMDAWCKNGLADDVPVRFNGKIGLWIRDYLTESFDLKKHPVWSKYAEVEK